MKKQTLCSLLTFGSLVVTGCVGTPTMPFEDVLTTAPLFRTLEKQVVEQELDEAGTTSLSKSAQQELNRFAKSQKVEQFINSQRC